MSFAKKWAAAKNSKPEDSSLRELAQTVLANDSLENEFGMTLIETKKVPIESLKFNRDYQRVKQPARVKQIKQGMIACGQFLPDRPITVNQKNEVVDGQHRLWAAMEMGYSIVPIVKYHFKTPELEAKYFIFINNYDPRLKATDYWYANLLSKDPIAIFLYRLDEDFNSALKNKIALKGKETNHKWSITPTLEVIGLALGYSNENWTKSLHGKWVAALKFRGQKEVMLEVNEFVVWYEAIFGLKNKNPFAYYLDSFRAIKLLYYKLKRKGWHNQPTTINKMKSFQIDSAFIAAPLAGKKQLLIGHYNHRKKKEVLDYLTA
jgi:hypothetical protein